jgi:glycosyltransferase involved in cell wall biosynthesis
VARSGVRYEICGTGPDQAYLEELAEYLGIAKRVRFVGHAANVRAVWERNHVMVLTSRIEGLPLTLVEASICGRPSIVTDVGGIRRWAADGDFAFIAAGPSLHAVSAAFESACNAMPRWRDLGVRASRHAIAWHGGDPAAALLRRVADGSAPARAARG